ncbi:MAG: tRNA dihydrouridine synthase DusB [Candidatus Omnitrophota bacterium]|jgi:nifR3 family TIM-barrel protein
MSIVKIGNKVINTNILLAPLAGCSDLAFRLICREQGAKFCFFEMIDANSLIHNRNRSLRLIKTNETDMPIAAQLLGRDPEVILEAAQRLLSLVNITFLDLNCACPVRKVIKRKSGAYLLTDTDTLSKIIKKLSASLPLPITAKIRVGYAKKDLKEISQTAKLLEASGASAIFVHGRTKTQGYSGEVDYASIKAVKEAVGIPVFGSGNIFNPMLAKKMLDETGCNGILVARGALGKPWIFKEIENYLAGKTVVPITLPKLKVTLKKHLSYLDKYKETREITKVGFMRKLCLWYLKGFTDSAKIRNRICSIKSYEEVFALIDNLPDNLAFVNR